MGKLKDFFSLDSKKNKKKEVMRSYKKYPVLAKIKARERYVFHSDYFMIDNYYAMILMFNHKQGAQDGYSAFWGVNLIPNDLPEGVTTLNIDQVERMGEKWVQDNQPRAERVSNKNELAQKENGSMTDKAKAWRSRNDLAIIAQELNNGASYLNVKDRLMIKAPTLEKLEEAYHKIQREYTDRFGSLTPAPYQGRQRSDFSTMLAQNKAKYGKGFYFTSTEFAGMYNLVTNGLEDPGGEYVGYMTGDVNNSAVLFDGDNFSHHAVIASAQFDNSTGSRQHVADMWGVKLGQVALLNNHKVVHIVLSPETKLNLLGPSMDDMTYKIDMNSGDVNMFEMFGKHKDELSIFAQQMEKIVLMTEQIYKPNDEEKAIIENNLRTSVKDFYISQGMWFENAQSRREDLRVVGIPHNEVPKLDVFVSYLDLAYKAALNAPSQDNEQVHATHVLSGIFHNLLTADGDLFDTHTNPLIDGVVSGRRVVYDFGSLVGRDMGVAMAQLINILGYAVSNLSDGDMLIIHGAENINPGIRDYCEHLFSQMYGRGARIVFLYNDIDKFLNDQPFNHFDQADYTILGSLSYNQIDDYEDRLGATVPSDLRKLITAKDQTVNYIRRGTSNVVFVLRLPLRPNQYDYGKKKRRHY